MESHCKCKLDADLAVAQDAIFSLYWRGRSRRHLSLVPALSNTPLRWHCESVLSYSRASQNHHPPVIPGNGCPVQGGEADGTQHSNNVLSEVMHLCCIDSRHILVYCF